MVTLLFPGAIVQVVAVALHIRGLGVLLLLVLPLLLPLFLPLPLLFVAIAVAWTVLGLETLEPDAVAAYDNANISDDGLESELEFKLEFV